MQQTVKDFDILIREGEPTRDRTFLDRIVDSVDKITRSPEAVREVANRLETQIKDTARTVTGRSEDVARENLTRQGITGYFTRFGDWIQKGNNLWWTLGGVAILIFLLRGR